MGKDLSHNKERLSAGEDSLGSEGKDFLRYFVPSVLHNVADWSIDTLSPWF